MKIAKLKTYQVESSERVFYSFQIRAENQKDAEQQAIEYFPETKDITDCEGYEYEVTELKQ